MKAILCRNFGPVEALQLEDAELAPLARDEVLVRVHACGINFPDVLMIEGKYQECPPLPFIPGGEVAGTVVEVGCDVQGVVKGQAVMATIFRGGLAELVNVPASILQEVPTGMSLDIAAAFPGACLTSYYALTRRGHLAKGETLLVLGAAGGVGTAAVQIGRVLGARVIAAASTDEKLAHARAHGANELINYTREDLRDRVRQLTASRGVDVIFDPVGGDLFDVASRCTAWNGRILVVGFASGRIPQLPANRALLKGSALVGVYYGRFCAEEPLEACNVMSEVSALYHGGGMVPHIDRRFPLGGSVEALTHVRDRKVRGKVIVQVQAIS